MFRQALTKYEKALGPEHTSTLDTVHNLSLQYADQGKLDETEQMFRRVLTGNEKILESKHTLMLILINNLNLLYVD
jgi:Tfp pilus assembly protein PilF